MNDMLVDNYIKSIYLHFSLLSSLLSVNVQKITVADKDSFQKVYLQFHEYSRCFLKFHVHSGIVNLVFTNILLDIFRDWAKLSLQKKSNTLDFAHISTVRHNKMFIFIQKQIQCCILCWHKVKYKVCTSWRYLVDIVR